MKHAQTIGLLERTHASVKTHLKAATGAIRNNYFPLAVLNHHTTYHASHGCEQSRDFHGRIPHNKLTTTLDTTSILDIRHNQTLLRKLKKKEYSSRPNSEEHNAVLS